MNKKKIIALSVIILLVIIAVFLLKRMRPFEGSSNLETGYVFDKGSNIKLKDIETFYRVIDFKQEDAKSYFKDSVLNAYTIKFLMFLDENFKEFDNKKDLFDNVQKYLYAVMPKDMADKLFDLYKKFVEYQLTLGEKQKEWGIPKNPEQAIDFLHKLQDYRREYFGREVADILFGASVKGYEYPIRRRMILKDKDLYAIEKEKKLRQLNEDMWGNEADQVNHFASDDPYVQYLEKMDIYQKDLSEMNEEQKKAQIRAFKEEFFTPDQIQRWEIVEKAIVERDQKEKAYKEKEREILSDSNLEKAEKEKRLEELQNQMFGEEAEAMRRKWAIERGTEDIMKNY